MQSPNVHTGKIRLTLSIVALALMAVPSVVAQTGNQGNSPKRPVKLPGVFSGAEHREKRAQELERERQERERYKGISVKTDPKATGDDLALQKRIADLLSAMDIVPSQRVECFKWMSKNKYLKITGWYGAILDVTSDLDGAIVTLEVRPRHDLDGSFATSSHTVERYRFANGKLRFLELFYKAGVGTWN
jgi:hypothetical protein